MACTVCLSCNRIANKAESDAWTDRRVSVQVNYHISARHHKSRSWSTVVNRDGRRGERSFNALGPTVLSHSLTVHAERETREAEFNTVSFYNNCFLFFCKNLQCVNAPSLRTQYRTLVCSFDSEKRKRNKERDREKEQSDRK